MDDDLNTPSVLQHIEKCLSEGKKKEARRMLDILGFNFK
jgi:16S rRNA U516 pseudouridylate synthase RsuA-like enzyme